MAIVDFDYLLWRMTEEDEQAFLEFEGEMRGRVAEWLWSFGLSEAAVKIECPRCLLELGILAVCRKDEITPGHFLTWCHAVTRNLVVRYWREAESQTFPPPVVSAAYIRVLTDRIDGSALAYYDVASRLKVSADQLKQRYKRLQQPGSFV